jgi:hypothetical protein
MPRLPLQIISLTALVGTILPAILFLAGRMELATSKHWLLAATILWFAATPLWMGREKNAA